jgi:hypothetical protein
LLTKADFLALCEATNAAKRAAQDAYAESDFEVPTDGPMMAIAPTCGDIGLLIASRVSFHAGQFSDVRCELRKPVLFRWR